MLTKFRIVKNCSRLIWADAGVVILRCTPDFKEYYYTIIEGNNVKTHDDLNIEIEGLFKYADDSWIVGAGRDNTLRLDKDFNLIEKLQFEGAAIMDINQKSDYFIVSNWKLTTPTISFFSKITLEELWKTKDSISIFGNHIFEYTNKDAHKLSKIDLTKNAIKWESDLEKLNYFGLWPLGIKSNVIFFMNDKAGVISDTIALNINNGELLWKLDIPFKKYYKVDARYDKLISLYDGYTERDLHTGQIILEHKDENVYKEFDARSRGSNFCQVGKYLIAIVYGKNKIFIYNTETYNFDYVYTDPEVKTYVTAHDLVFHNNQLFLKDLNSNMHIYKFDQEIEV